MKRFWIFFFLFILFVLLFGSYFLYTQSKYIVGRASISPASFSIDNSYVFLTPLKARATGQEKVRLTVFILNNQGLGISGKEITLQSVKNLRVSNVQAVTDSLGKGIFDISSTIPGEYYISVMVDGSVLAQRAHATFY